MIQDRIELNLSNLKTLENLDRIAEIQRLLRQVLFSTEVSPKADDDGEWTMDFDWDAELLTVTMKKVVRPAHRGQVKR